MSNFPEAMPHGEFEELFPDLFFIGGTMRGEFFGVGQRVTALQGGHDSLYPSQGVKGPQGLVVVRHHVINSADILEPGVLRSDPGVVQAGGY